MTSLEIDSWARPWRVAILLAPLVLGSGCGKPAPAGSFAQVNPRVHLYKMQKQSLVTSMGQPAFVYPYEQTSLFPKVSGFVDKWLVDIGDHIKKGQELAHIAVPELVQERDQAKAQVALDTVMVEVDQQLVEVAISNKKVAEAQEQSAQHNAQKYEADLKRWQSEVERLSKLTNIIDPQNLQESQKQLQVSIASLAAARSDVVAAKATATSRQAEIDKAKADVDAAKAQIKVSEAKLRRLEALVSYTFVIAPYDGIVIDRNANTGDYVEPARGDLSAGKGSSNQSAGQGSPLYVVATMDRIRIYIDVPESLAAFVKAGTSVRIVFEAERGDEVEAKVTRTSWSLQYRSRTLRAEVDLPNPGGKFYPGMYAYAHILIDQVDVWAVPIDAVVDVSEQKCVYLYENGKAIKTPVQAGISDGKHTELFHKQVKGVWVDFDGLEQVILGELPELSNGRTVDVEK